MNECSAQFLCELRLDLFCIDDVIMNDKAEMKHKNKSNQIKSNQINDIITFE